MKAGDPVDLDRPAATSPRTARRRQRGDRRGSWPRSPRWSRTCAARRRPPSASTRDAPGVREIGNPNKKRREAGMSEGRGLRRRLVGHGVLDRAGRRRQRRDDLGPPRGGLRRRSTSGARTPTTCPASSCRRTVVGHPRPRGGRRTAPTWSCFAVPSQTFRENLDRVGRRASRRGAVLVSLMKGVELGTLKRMSEVIAEVTGAGPERIAVVSGPNLSKEIARREPAASVVACADEDVAKRLQDAVPLAGVPSLHLRRRARLRARRRLQERRRPRRRHGRRARASATTPRPRSSPAASPRPPGWRWRSAPTR